MRRRWPRGAAAVALAPLVVFFYHGLFQGLIIGDYDAFVYFYPLRDYAARVLRQGHFPLWNPDLFMGSPFFANVQTAVLYPPNVLFLILPTPYAFSASVVLHVLLAAVGMYAFCTRVLAISRLPAVMGAVAFAFGGFISWQVSHINQLSVSAWLPLLLVAFDATIRRRSPGLGIATGLIATMQFLAGHTQEWYFSTAVLGLFALWRMAVPFGPGIETSAGLPEAADASIPRNKLLAFLLHDQALWLRLRPMAYLTLVGLVEAGVTAIQWMPTLELSKQSIRAGGMPYGEAVSFSLPPTTALYTLLPTYPSSLFSEYMGYIGVIPLTLAVLALLFRRRKPAVLLMAGLVVVGLFLAIGGYNPFAPFLFKRVPGLDLFRVPARWLLVYTFGAAGLSSLGAQAILDLAVRSGQSPSSEISSGRSRLSRFAVSTAIAGAVVGLLGILATIARPAPSLQDLAVWAVLVLAVVVVCSLAVVAKGTARAALGLLVLGAAVELWIAGGNAVFQHPIPYAAFRPQRSSTSYLLDNLAKDGAPERVLSVAPDNYEVKETPDYKKQYSWLDPSALEQFLVNVKLSETLASNIAMEYGIQSPDGYDGGVLPLKEYADLKSLVLPEDGAAADSQLRLNLPYVPDEKFLDLLGARYILGGKIKDTSVDNVYYDRGISVVLANGQSRTLTRMPDIQATSIGVISSTYGARKQEDGVVAGTLVVTDSDGVNHELPLRLGTETAETAEDDASLGPPAHKRPQQVATWPAGSKDTDYFAKIRLPARMKVKQITMKALLPGADLRVRAITLIDDVAAVSSPLVLSDALDREMFFDMKVYSYRNVLPRAFMVYNSVVRDDEPALGTLAQPETKPNQVAILAPSHTARTIFRSPAVDFQAGDARILSYEPEQVTIEATARENGYLLLMDSFYPGWVAAVDGKQQPIERADYMFRGVYLSKGSHLVVFKYVPDSFRVGTLVSATSLVLLAGAVLGMGVASHRRRHVL